MENRNEFRNHLETIPHPLCKNSFIALVPLLYGFLTAKGKLLHVHTTASWPAREDRRAALVWLAIFWIFVGFGFGFGLAQLPS